MQIYAYIITLVCRDGVANDVSLIDHVLDEYFCCHYRKHHERLSVAVCEDVKDNRYCDNFRQSYYNSVVRVNIVEIGPTECVLEMIEKCN